jgi:hypothetical protein
MSRPRSHHKRGPKPIEPKPIETYTPRVTSLRTIGFAEAKVNRTERKLRRPKQNKTAIRQNKALLLCVKHGIL